MYKEFQGGKSYMRKGFLIYEETHKYFTIYEDTVSHIWLCNCSILNFLLYADNFIFFFISVIAEIRRHAGGNSTGETTSKQADGNMQACIKSPINMYPIGLRKCPRAACSTYGHLSSCQIQYVPLGCRVQRDCRGTTEGGGVGVVKNTCIYVRIHIHHKTDTHSAIFPLSIHHALKILSAHS